MIYIPIFKLNSSFFSYRKVSVKITKAKIRPKNAIIIKYLFLNNSAKITIIGETQQIINQYLDQRLPLPQPEHVEPNRFNSISTTTSVVAVQFDKGVTIAGDSQITFNNMAKYFGIRRIIKVCFKNRPS